MYQVLINGTDRTKDVFGAQKLKIEDVLNDRQSTTSLILMNRFGYGWPDNEQEIIIFDSGGNRVFGGIIIKRTFLSKSSNGYGIPTIQLDCQDYVRLFDSLLVNKVYTNMTDHDIVQDIITTFCAGSGITGHNVSNNVTIAQMKFNYIQPSQALRKISDNTGANWYIDYNKDLHYFLSDTYDAPFNINTSTQDKIFNLNLSQDNSQLRNRVYVRGATRLSDNFAYKTTGDGQATQFVLPNKPHDTSVTVKVNGVTKTVGVVNKDTSGFDWYVDITNAYVQQDSGGTVLASTDILEVDYVYDVPIIVAVENAASIAEFGGIAKEFRITDKTIQTSQAASDRAIAELLDYGGTLNEGNFSTYTPGLRSGQQILITDADYGFTNQPYLIQKVVATSIGGGNFKYDVTLASAKTMGIIRFLIEMLESQQNQVDIADNEVIDNLESLNDTVSSPSESLTATLGPTTFDWATGPTDTSHAIWDLFQWA